MNPAHLPETAQRKLIHLIEECSEVTKVCTKIIRFGIDNIHPDGGQTNRQKLRDEISDLRIACQRVEESWEL